MGKKSKSKRTVIKGGLYGPIPEIYPLLDADIVRDYLENFADLMDE